jgi:hypothetical protein
MPSTRLGGYLDVCYWGFKLVLNYKLNQAFTGVKVTYDKPDLIKVSRWSSRISSYFKLKFV